ncbi:MAG: FGGY-family carbohydrate kinase [Actinobacteria bacterium]|nr:FGGY-family carbohydrate kinase [Actinomycetota bacterium]
MAPAHVLTVDLGTSGPKAAVVDDAGAVVGSARASVRTTFGRGGAAEQDAEAVWRATLEAALGALAAASVDPASIVAVIASAQYSSVVPVGEDCRPVFPMITWMDQRGSPKRIRRIGGPAAHRDPPTAYPTYLRVHGLMPFTAGMSLNHMRWVRAAEPEVYERTAAFLEPVDYLTARFTGRPTANQCTAFMQMLADNRTVPSVGWHPDLVAASGIDPEKLPEAVAAGQVVGPLLDDVAATLGLAPSTPVLSGINDTQAGAVAAGAHRGEHAGLAMGTTAVIVTHAPKKKIDPLHSMFTLPSPLGGRHLLSAENGVAGVAVDHFLDSFVYPDDAFDTAGTDVDRYEAFNEAAAAAPPGASGVLFLPWLRGSLAPRADGRARGGFLGVGLDTGRDDLARAVLEGVSLNLRWLQGPVEKFVGRTMSHYVFYGGGARSDLWSQIMADVLDKPVHQLASPGFANSLGTAIFAFDRLGMVDADDLAARVQVRAVREPDPSTRTRYDDLAATFTEAFKRTRPISRRLTRRS